MDYDLLIKGGHVIDAAQGISRPMDVAFAAGKVAAINPDIPSGSAREVVDAAGKFVTPGLIDCHAHFYKGDIRGIPIRNQGCDPDVTHIPNGCTTVIDAGSLEARDFPEFRRVASGRKCRHFALVNLLAPGHPLLQREIKSADPAGAAQIVRDNRDMVLGLKVFLCWQRSAGSDLEVVDLNLQAAEGSNGIIMVHVGNSLMTMPELLTRLRPGDIVTHCFSLEANCIVDSRLRILDAVWEARRRGIIFDGNRGQHHLSFKVARSALAQGFMPDCISTDMTNTNQKVVGGLLNIMSQFMAMGMSLDEIITRVTVNPAKKIICPHIDAKGLGTLQVGVGTDAAVLDLLEGQFTYVDSSGEEEIGKNHISCAMTIMDGKVVWRAASTQASATVT